MKTILIATFSITLLIGIIYGLYQPGGSSSINVLPLDRLTATDHVRGNRDAKIILIEYSDFQCPACAFYHPVLRELLTKFGNDLGMVYRHFPLPNHQNAQPAALAAEAAGKQGKFYEMHDQLFEKQEAWSTAKDVETKFVKYARELGLNVDQFRTDMQDGSVKEIVKQHSQSGTAANVRGTPTFFLNGKKIQNPRTLKDFEEIIQQEMST